MSATGIAIAPIPTDKGGRTGRKDHPIWGWSLFLKKRKKSKDQKDDETNLGNRGRGTGKGSKAESGRDESNKKKYYSVVKHGDGGGGWE